MAPKTSLRQSSCSPIGITLIALAAGMIVLLAATSEIREFDPDEFQHLQVAWLVASGEIPYKDFFEHHTPLYHFLISPLLSDKALITDGNAAERMVIALRWIGIVLSVGILALTYLITKMLAGRLQALFAVALMASSVVFIKKAIEIRPEQLALSLLLVSTLALALAKESNQWRWCFLLSGISTTLAVLANQKAILALPGLALTFCAVVAHRRLPVRNILQACGIIVAASVMAAIPLLWYFWSHDALGDFINSNFLIVAQWKHTSALRRLLAIVFREDILIFFLAGLGLLDCLAQERPTSMWRLAVSAPFFSMAFFMPIFPAVQYQYVLLMLPYLAILGGIGAAIAIKPLVALRSPILQFALVIPVMAVGLHALSLIADERSMRNNRTLEALRYIVERTPPDATVMTSWTPGIAFRKPAFFYLFLHPEIRFLIPEEAYASLAEGLRSRAVAPAVIEMDGNMKQLPSEILDLLMKGWEPTGVGNLWRRKTP